MKNLLESLGYKDITNNKPIHFIDCLGEFFDSVYPYNKRFYKQEGNMTIELKTGNCHNICFISGICYYPKEGWEKFEVCAPKDYIDKEFMQILNAVKLHLVKKINCNYALQT